MTNLGWRARLISRAGLEYNPDVEKNLRSRHAWKRALNNLFRMVATWRYGFHPVRVARVP